MPITTKDSTITLTAYNTDFTVIDIKSIYGASSFSIVNTVFPLVIPKNSSKIITLRFAPTDSTQVYDAFEIKTNLCSYYFTANGGFAGKKMRTTTLKLSSPNGGETFLVGSDTLITWQGVAVSDTVTLEYSIDNGASWKLITEKATGLQYNWRNMLKPTSNQCLIKVSQYFGGTTKNSVPSIQWQKKINGLGGQANSVQQTFDGGYIVGGELEYYTANLKVVKSDFLVIKFNSSGSFEWQKQLGGSNYDFAYSIQQASDGGFIITGTTNSLDRDVLNNKGGFDCWIVKLNPIGLIEWQKTFGGSAYDASTSVKQTIDGGYIVAGLTSSNDGDITDNNGGIDYWVVKFNQLGEIEWQKTFGGSLDDYAQSIEQTIDSGYIVGGYTASNDKDVVGFKGKTDYWILKLNSTGSIEWQKTMGGSSFDYLRSIKQTNDSSYIIAGYTASSDNDITNNHGKGDCWITKISTRGTIEWQKTFGGSQEDNANSIFQTSDGGYVFGGYTESSDGDIKRNYSYRDSWVVKITANGLIEFQLNLGGGGFENEAVHSIQQTIDGGYIITGYKNAPWVAKLPPAGGLLQEDISDKVFSIVLPSHTTDDVNMYECLLGSVKDSVIQGFIQNKGSCSFRVDSIAITGAYASLFSLVSGVPPFTVPANGAFSVEFRFCPTSIGIKTAQLTIITQSDTLLQTIQGEGVASEIEVVNKFIDFGKVAMNTTPKDTFQVLTIKNISSNPLEIISTRQASPNDIDFTTIAGGGNFTLQPGDTAKLDLRFSPKAIGRTSGRLLFDYNGFGSPVAVQLFGEGTVPDTARTTIAVQNILAQAGDRVFLTLKLDKPSGMQIAGAPTEWYARIHYNKTILFNEQTSNSCLSGTDDSCVIELNGTYDPKSNDLISIPCIATLGNTDNSTLVIDEFRWTNGSIVPETETKNGSITINGICEQGGVRLFIPAKNATSLSTRPNPAQNSMQIQYGLREPLTVTLELLDITGQIVQTILSNQQQAAGQYTLVNDMSLLGNGIYSLRLTTNKEVLTTRVDVVK